MIKLVLDDLIKLYKLASIGKLFGGLIHNLNGPMQNLGLDIEMSCYTLKEGLKSDPDIAKTIVSRLKRMEEEHDKINALIRATSSKIEDKADVDNTILSNIHEFLKEEMAFLDANLYFKHNVQKEIINTNEAGSLSTLSKDSLTALGWFLQYLAEDLERQKLRGLTIKIMSDNSSPRIIFSTQGGRLSEGFTGQFKKTALSTDITKSDDMDMGIFLVLLIFQSNGVTFDFKAGPASSNIAINFP